MKVLEQCCSIGGEGDIFNKIIVLEKSKWKMHSNKNIRIMLLYREGNNFAKIKIENVLWILLLEAIKLLNRWKKLLSY